MPCRSRVRVSPLAVALLLGVSAERVAAQDKPALYAWVSASSPPPTVMRGPDAPYPPVCRANGRAGSYLEGTCQSGGDGMMVASRDQLQFLVLVAGTPLWMATHAPVASSMNDWIVVTTKNLVPGTIDTGRNEMNISPQWICSWLGLVGKVYDPYGGHCAIPMRGDTMNARYSTDVLRKQMAVALIGTLHNTDQTLYEWVVGTTPASNPVTALESPRTEVCRAAAPDGIVTPGFWGRGACQLYFHDQVVASTTKLGFLASRWREPDWSHGSVSNMLPDANQRVAGVHQMVEGGKDAKGNSFWICSRGGFVGYLETEPTEPPLCLTAAGAERGSRGWSVDPGARAMALSGTVR